MTKLSFILILLLSACGENANIYETSCPLLEKNEWLGFIETESTIKNYAYWACVNDNCGDLSNYNIRVEKKSPRLLKVCCGGVDNRVDSIKIVEIKETEIQ